MHLDTYIESIRRHLEASAAAGGGGSDPLVERLLLSLDSALRLALLEALAAAAEEITVELAPGSVELRLRGRDPEFVVALPPIDPSLEDAGDAEASGSSPIAVPAAAEGDDTMSRINLRLPEQLKALVEQVASGEGLSVNSWLVRAAASAVERNESALRRERRTPHGPRRYTGWGR